MASVNHSLLYDPQVKRALDAVRAGALGQVVSVDILRGSEYPPYEGGPLPPWYRDAGYPFRDLGVHCLYLIQELLGPIEDVDAEWRSLGGDPNLAFDEWRALVRCKRGLGQFQLTWNTKPMQSQMIIHGTKGVLRVDLFAMFHGKRASTPLPKAAERLVNAFADSIQPLIDVPIGVWKFVRKEVQAYQGLRDLVADFYRRLAAGEPPPVSVEDAAEVVRWVEKVARAAEADHTARLARFPLSPTRAVPRHRRVGLARHGGRAAAARRGQERARVRAPAIPDEPVDGVEYASATSAIRTRSIARSAGAETRDPRRRRDEGRLARAPRRHRRRHAERDRRVQEARGAAARPHLVDVGRRLGRLAGNAARSARTLRSSRVPTSAARTRARSSRPSRLVSDAAGDGLPVRDPAPGPDLRRRHPADQRRGRAQRRRPLARPRRRQARAAARLHRRRRRRDHGRRSTSELVDGEIIQIIDPEQLTQDDVLGLAAAATSAILRVPRPVVFALGKLSEYPLGALGVQSPVALYRLRSALARVDFESRHAEERLDWRPRVGVREGIRRVRSEAARTH